MDCHDNDPKPAPPGAPQWNHFWLMEALGLLRPELQQAIPITQRRDGTYYLVGLRFGSAAEAAGFAQGLEEFCECDGERLLLKVAPPIVRDEQGNCWGIN